MTGGMFTIPIFLKRDKKPVSAKIRHSRVPRIKITVPQPPRNWRNAEKVRVTVGTGWPRSFPPGNRTCLVKRGKTNRSSFVVVKEWPCFYGTTHRVNRAIFEQSVQGV